MKAFLKLLVHGLSCLDSVKKATVPLMSAGHGLSDLSFLRGISSLNLFASPPSIPVATETGLVLYNAKAFDIIPYAVPPAPQCKATFDIIDNDDDEKSARAAMTALINAMSDDIERPVYSNITSSETLLDLVAPSPYVFTSLIFDLSKISDRLITRPVFLPNPRPQATFTIVELSDTRASLPSGTAAYAVYVVTYYKRNEFFLDTAELRSALAERDFYFWAACLLGLLNVATVTSFVSISCYSCRMSIDVSFCYYSSLLRSCICSPIIPLLS